MRINVNFSWECVRMNFMWLWHLNKDLNNNLVTKPFITRRTWSIYTIVPTPSLIPMVFSGTTKRLMIKVHTAFPSSQKVALCNVTSEAKLIRLGALDCQCYNFVNTLSLELIFEGIFWIFNLQVLEYEWSWNMEDFTNLVEPTRLLLAVKTVLGIKQIYYQTVRGVVLL